MSAERTTSETLALIWAEVAALHLKIAELEADAEIRAREHFEIVTDLQSRLSLVLGEVRFMPEAPPVPEAANKHLSLVVDNDAGGPHAAD